MQIEYIMQRVYGVSVSIGQPQLILICTRVEIQVQSIKLVEMYNWTPWKNKVVIFLNSIEIAITDLHSFQEVESPWLMAGWEEKGT